MSRYSFVFWFSMLLLMTSSLKRGPKYSRLEDDKRTSASTLKHTDGGRAGVLVVVGEVLVKLLAEDDSSLVRPCPSDVLR